MAGRIEEDLNIRPPADWRIIYLGDYVDRGPHSAEVIDLVLGQMAARRVYALRGNHDQFLIDFLAGADGGTFAVWMDNGGFATLASYGIGQEAALRAFSREGTAALRETLLAEMPAAHARFLAGLPHMVRLGDYAFVHAGVRPGVRLERQSAADLLWIRDEFLGSDAQFGAVVVHGHTVSEGVTVRRNRIGIDTGLVYGGWLTCLVLEGQEKALLEPDGLLPLGAPA